jgi:hypothetical protein
VEGGVSTSLGKRRARGRGRGVKRAEGLDDCFCIFRMRDMGRGSPGLDCSLARSLTCTLTIKHGESKGWMAGPLSPILGQDHPAAIYHRNNTSTTYLLRPRRVPKRETQSAATAKTGIRINQDILHASPSLSPPRLPSHQICQIKQTHPPSISPSASPSSTQSSPGYWIEMRVSTLLKDRASFSPSTQASNQTSE